MTRMTHYIALIAGILACADASAAASPDYTRIEAMLETLQQSVSHRDFGILEPALDESFSYQGQGPDLSRMIMRQVVQGYPHDIDDIAVLSVTPDDDGWSVRAAVAGPQGSREHLIRLSTEYRIVRADIAEIQLAGHGARPTGLEEDRVPTPSPRTRQVPFVVHKGQIVVQAAINGVAGNFLIDTGAQVTTVNTAHFAEDQLSTQPFNHGRPSGVGGALTGARGAPRLKLAWDDTYHEVPLGLALDLSHFETSMGIPIVGLIGFDILARFEIHFDYDAGLLTLYPLGDDKQPGDADQRGTPLATLVFDMVGHIPVFPVRIGGQDLRLGLDSGAAEAMLAEEWQDTMSGEYEFVRTAEMRGADKAVRQSTEVRFDWMTVSNVEYDNVLFRFNDILLASGDSPDMDGLLGYQFLSARPTSINFRTRQLSIW